MSQAIARRLRSRSSICRGRGSRRSYREKRNFDRAPVGAAQAATTTHRSPT
ncbi:hypothetical protein LC55x_2812 [Lysobacter capsici]|nr:hypothetical protein LC55x_2812 [Lysobacter capsici]